RTRARTARRLGQVVALPWRGRPAGGDPPLGRGRGRAAHLARRRLGPHPPPPARGMGRELPRAARRAGRGAHGARLVRRGGARADARGGARRRLSRRRPPRKTTGRVLRLALGSTRTTPTGKRE